MSELSGIKVDEKDSHLELVDLLLERLLGALEQSDGVLGLLEVDDQDLDLECACLRGSFEILMKLLQTTAYLRLQARLGLLELRDLLEHDLDLLLVLGLLLQHLLAQVLDLLVVEHDLKVSKWNRTLDLFGDV